MDYEKKDIIRESKQLYGEINSCITDIVNARIAKNLYNEGRAIFKMEGLMVATMQHLGCVIDFLEEQKESLHIPEMCKENADSFTDEDERIREFLIDLLSHGTWKKDWPFSPAECVAWLEKQKEPENISASTMAPSCWELEQKEQKPVEPSDEELERHQEELYNFKVFAAKQAKEHHISFVHDFEWNNFCAELLSYFNEKQKPVEIHIDNPNIEKFDPDVKITTSDSSADGVKSIEWSERDDMLMDELESYILYDKEFNDEQKSWRIKRLKSLRPQPHCKISDELDIDTLRDWSMRFAPDIREAIEATAYHFYNIRPHWKPTEEQMESLNYAIAEWDGGKKLEGLYALRNDLKKLM